MITITGYSDDIVYIESDGDSEEVSAFESLVQIKIENEQGGVEINTWYEGPSWAFTFFQMENEEIEVPWPIEINQDSSYSMKIEIHCPENTKYTFDVIKSDGNVE